MSTRPNVSAKRFAGVYFAAALLCTLLLSSCQLAPPSGPAQAQAAPTVAVEEKATEEKAPAGHAVVTSEEHRPELEMESPIALEPGKGSEIGSIFEAFLSPHQQA